MVKRCLIKDRITSGWKVEKMAANLLELHRPQIYHPHPSAVHAAGTVKNRFALNI